MQSTYQSYSSDSRSSLKQKIMLHYTIVSIICYMPMPPRYSRESKKIPAHSGYMHPTIPSWSRVQKFRTIVSYSIPPSPTFCKPSNGQLIMNHFSAHNCWSQPANGCSHVDNQNF